MGTIAAQALGERAVGEVWADDRESASEILAAEMAAVELEKPEVPVTPGRSPIGDREDSVADRIMGNPAVESFLRSAATAAGREITRSLFGTVAAAEPKGGSAGIRIREMLREKLSRPASRDHRESVGARR